MRHVQKEVSWLLLEAPVTIDHAKDWLSAAARRCAGVIVRLGEGVSPIVLGPLIRREGIEPGIFLHLRDMNRIALGSLIRSALALDVKCIFVGDPFPSPSVNAVGSSDGPSFVEFARVISGDRIRYGVCNLLSHPHDLTLASKHAQSGIRIIAIPPTAMGRPVFPKVESWNWRRTPQDHADSERPNLLDLASRGPLTPSEVISGLDGFFAAG